MIISNCVVTQSNATVLKEYVDSKTNPLYRKYNGFHTGVDLRTKEVYNLCPSNVVYVGQDSNKTYTVILQYNRANSVSYSNLKQVIVEPGQFIDYARKLGDCKDYVHVEYLSDTKSEWPVRIGESTLYKHNPTSILTDGYDSFIDYYESITAINYVFLDEKDPLANQEVKS